MLDGRPTPSAQAEPFEVEAGPVLGDVLGDRGLLAFGRLDLMLDAAMVAAAERYGPDAATDSFRGLYLAQEQVDRALRRPAAQPLLRTVPSVPGWDDICADNAAWLELRERYGLDDRELDVLLIGLAPDVDRRYEQLYGYLQDDVSARRPSVNMALDLLTPTPAARVRALDLFGCDAALCRHRLVSLRCDPRTDDPPLIAHLVAVDQQVMAAVLGLTGLDRRLSPFCRLHPVDQVGTPADIGPSDDTLVRTLTGFVRSAPGPVRLCFHGPPGTGRRATARALARSLRAPLLEVEAVGLLAAGGVSILPITFREAEFRRALLYLDDVETLRSGLGDSGFEAFTQALAAHRRVVVMAASAGWAPAGHRPLGVADVAFSRPSAADRRQLWQQAVRRATTGTPLRAAGREVAAVSDRFQLSAGQIEDAALTATAAVRLRDPAGARISAADLFAAARRQSGGDLGGLARRVPLVHGWDDLVVPDEALRHLRELTDRIEHRAQVLDGWRFGARMSGGKGVSALFAGPPGTGKTMAAGVIAAALGLDLFTIDLSTVVSKYIGETEKNLSRVFAAAADSDAILFFDEADALFGKRSDVRDAHDRYANIEIAYLLQRMEQYEGLAVLATNLRHHLDDAFTRRLHAVVEFPFPEAAERLRIWRTCLPPQAPLAADVDLELLAAHRLAGGNIRNVVLAAAYLAAAQGGPIGAVHFAEAVRREMQKMGKVADEGGV